MQQYHELISFKLLLFNAFTNWSFGYSCMLMLTQSLFSLSSLVAPVTHVSEELLEIYLHVNTDSLPPYITG